MRRYLCHTYRLNTLLPQMTIFPVNTNRGDIRITVQMGSPFLICQTLDFNRMDNQEKLAALDTQDTGRGARSGAHHKPGVNI